MHSCICNHSPIICTNLKKLQPHSMLRLFIKCLDSVFGRSALTEASITLFLLTFGWHQNVIYSKGLFGACSFPVESLSSFCLVFRSVAVCSWKFKPLYNWKVYYTKLHILTARFPTLLSIMTEMPKGCSCSRNIGCDQFIWWSKWVEI